MTTSKKKGQARSGTRVLRACALERDKQRAQLRVTAWDVVDATFFLVTLTTVLGVTAVLVTLADALWHWWPAGSWTR